MFFGSVKLQQIGIWRKKKFSPIREIFKPRNLTFYSQNYQFSAFEQLWHKQFWWLKPEICFSWMVIGVILNELTKTYKKNYFLMSMAGFPNFIVKNKPLLH